MYIIYDDFFLKHHTGSLHPEKGERLSCIKTSLKNWSNGPHLYWLTPARASLDIISLIHHPDYIRQIKHYSTLHKLINLDTDTVVSHFTYDCAVLAAGAAVQGIDQLFSTGAKSSMFFALVRPPGHHAFENRGTGFCIFNQIAIAAAYALREYKVERIAIIDFDAHHGNGTQHLFYGDQHVFFVSFHQYPHYPGTGTAQEAGIKEGKGYSLNFPFAPGTGQDCYLYALDQVVVPLMLKFCPQLVLVSAGYDSHAEDHLSSLKLTESSYNKIMKVVSSLSRICSRGRLGIFLEGGYNTDVLGDCVKETVKGCLDTSYNIDNLSQEYEGIDDGCRSLISYLSKKFGVIHG
ncbi:MAG: histone deacetylase [Actinomycetota bacterium]|nr:histone deacetylase [Actinomycetota bacterium]